MTLQPLTADHKQLRATAAELQTMSELIQRYPAEAQLIMSALEDGLTLGPMRTMDTDRDPSSTASGRPSTSGIAAASSGT